MKRVRATFDVTLEPLDPDAPAEAATSRMSIGKTLSGDRVGTGVGEMLSGGAPAAEGSAGSVAIERIAGSLEGRDGSPSTEIPEAAAPGSYGEVGPRRRTPVNEAN